MCGSFMSFFASALSWSETIGQTMTAPRGLYFRLAALHSLEDRAWQYEMFGNTVQRLRHSALVKRDNRQSVLWGFRSPSPLVVFYLQR